ncbi:MAG: hypothetical protein HZB29_01255 [Nitrospinae bacterium]|nr:hypothetical protein [Nitrospinota bacterium]
MGAAILLGPALALLALVLLETASYLYLKYRVGMDLSHFAHNFIRPSSEGIDDKPLMSVNRYFSSTRIMALQPNSSAGGLKINKDGFFSNRNDGADSYENPKPYGVFRIILLGGSAAAGQGASSNEATLAAVLERALAGKVPGAKNIEVINAAIGGLSSPLVTMAVMNELIPSFRPDMILLLDGVTDAITCSAHSGNYYREQLNHVLGVGDFDGYIQKMQRGDISFMEFMEMKLGITPGNLDGYYFITALKARQAFKESAKAGPGPEPEATAECDISDYLYYSAATRSLLRDNKVRFLHVLQPTLIFKKSLSPREATALAEKEWKEIKITKESFKAKLYIFFDGASAAFDKIGKEEDSPLVKMADLSRLFEDESGEIFVDYGHYNDIGNRRIGESLASLALEMTNRK